MYVLLIVAVVLIAVLLFLLDRALKALARGRRRRHAAIRLTAAAAKAQNEARAQHVSGALTTVLPAIKPAHEGPRRVA